MLHISLKAERLKKEKKLTIKKTDQYSQLPFGALLQKSLKIFKFSSFVELKIRFVVSLQHVSSKLSYLFNSSIPSLERKNIKPLWDAKILGAYGVS